LTRTSVHVSYFASSNSQSRFWLVSILRVSLRTSSTPFTTFAIFIILTYASTPSAFRVVKSSSNLSRH
ncbi:hypothetical protein BJV78DRAFT_1222909, partial [Lactifluus subvellereus]